MTTTTVNPIQSTGFKLTAAENPIIFGATTNIDNSAGWAVTGDASQTWTVTNQGKLAGYSGVDLVGGGSITNSGSISAAGSISKSYGVLESAAGSLDNSGKITSETFGVVLAAGGTVTNELSGEIDGGTSTLATHAWAVAVKGASGSVANSGAISITGAQFVDAVYLSAGGSVNNSGKINVTDNNYLNGIDLLSSGAVTNSGIIAAAGGYAHGIYLRGGGAASNSGTITTSGGYDIGIYMKAGGSATNMATGSISGDTGVKSHVGGSLDNFGKISGKSDGVHFSSGGTILNEKGAVISGDASAKSNVYGVFASGAASAVTNNGTISVTGSALIRNDDGVELKAGGSVVNAGAIKATNVFYSAAISLYAGGSATNSGALTVSGSNDAGIYLKSGGSVANSGSVTVTGTHVQGVYLVNGGAVTNSGTIKVSGTSAYGVYLKNGGTLTNSAGKSILSYAGAGVYTFGKGVKITNAGTIRGSTASIVFAGYAVNALTLQTGAKLIGNAVGSTVAGATNTLTLQGTGTASNAFLHFNSLAVQTGAAWTLSGASAIGASSVAGALTVTGKLTSAITIAVGGVAKFVGGGSSASTAFALTNHGKLDIGAAGMTLSDAVSIKSLTNSGAIALVGAGAAHGVLSVSGGVTNTGTVSVLSDSETLAGVIAGTGGAFDLNGGATLQFNAGVGSGQTVKFAGSGNDLALKAASSFAGLIAGFGSGDTIDAMSIAFSTLKHNYSAGDLNLSGGGKVANLHFSGAYTNASFSFAADAGGGTLIHFV